MEHKKGENYRSPQTPAEVMSPSRQVSVFLAG
jgi:hypothetical protein